MPEMRTNQDGPDPRSPKGEGDHSGNDPAGQGDEPKVDNSAAVPPRGDSKYFSSLKPWELELPTVGNAGGGPPTPVVGRRSGGGGDDEVPVVPGVEVVKLIKHGGQGSVYEGWKKDPGTRVAVKVPRCVEGQISPRACDLLRREGELLTRMSHPKVVRLLGRGEGAVHCERMVPFLILELVESGKPIDAYAADLNLTARQCVELMIGVCDGVQHINDRCSIHRDLKPQNILVDRHGAVKIIDVGLAATGDVQAERREAGQAVGTWPYMAPEQVNGEPTLMSGRTDVYALGMITFKVLGKRLALPIGVGDAWPYVKRTILETPAQKLRELTPFPTTLGDLAPALDELSRVVDVAMRKWSASTGRARWDSPSVLGRELRSVLETGKAGPAPGDSIETAMGAGSFGTVNPMPPDPVVVVERARRRPWIWAALGGVAAVAVVLGVGFGGAAAREVGLTRVFDRFAFSSDETPESVAVILVRSKEDITRAADYVRKKGVEIPEFDADSPQTWRPIWTYLLGVLSSGGAKTVTFDIVMRPRAEEDSEGRPKAPEILAKEAEIDQLLGKKARECGIPVIFAVDGGIANNVGTQGQQAWITSINQVIVEWGRHGAVSALCSSDEAWEVDLAFHRGTKQKIVGLGLATYAAYALPNASPEFELESGDRHICINGNVKDGPVERIAGETQYVGVSELSDITRVTQDDRQSFGLEPGDKASTLLLRMRSGASLSKVTLGLEEALKSEGSHKGLVSGRAIFIGNAIPRPKADIYEYLDRRMIHGAWAHAMAVEQMCRSECIRKAGRMSWTGVACAAALFPVLMARPWRHARGNAALTLEWRRYSRRVIGPLAAATAVLGLGAFALVKLALLSFPMAPAITAMWLSAAGVALVHWILRPNRGSQREPST